MAHADAQGPDLFAATVAPIDAREALRDLGKGTCDHMQNLLDSDGASVTVVDGDHLEYVCGTGLATGLIGRRVSLTGSHTGRVVLDRKPRFFRFSPSISEGTRERASKHNINSGIVVPVIGANERVYGTIGVASTKEEAYEEADIERLEKLARFVAGTLDRDLERAFLERERSWARVRRLGALIAGGQLASIVDALDALDDADGAAVTRARDAASELLDRLHDMRVGHPDDQPTTDEKARPVSTPLGVPALELGGSQTIDVGRELRRGAGFLARELDPDIVLEARFEQTIEGEINGPEGTLTELVVHMVWLLADRVAHDETSDAVRMTLAATAGDAEASLHLRAEVAESPADEAAHRADLSSDPFVRAGVEGGASEALIRHAARLLGATLDIAQLHVCATIPAVGLATHP